MNANLSKYKDNFLTVSIVFIFISIYCGFMYLNINDKFNDKPSVLKISDSNVYFFNKDGSARWEVSNILFDNDGVSYLSYCDDFISLCSDSDSGKRFIGRNVEYLMFGKQGGKNGKFLGVLLSGNFVDEKGNVQILKHSYSEAFSIGYRHAKFGRNVLLFSMGSLFISLLGFFIYFKASKY